MKRGISLIVLIITIIVIIIIAGAVILSLANNNPITQSQEAAFKQNVSTYNSELNTAISKLYVDNPNFDPNNFNATAWSGANTAITGSVKQYITSMVPEDGTKFEIHSGKLVYVSNNVQEQSWSTSVGVNAATSSVILDFSDTEGVNVPKLFPGMTAVRWNGSQWIDVADPMGDTSWYNYAKQIGNTVSGGTSEWANARSNDGSMWVWIPRYAYKITTPGTSAASSIDVIFLKSRTNFKVDNGTLPTGYIVHPAFINDASAGGWDQELTGIWVSKYEAGYPMSSKGDSFIASNEKYSTATNTTNFYGAIVGGTTIINYPTFKANRYSYNFINMGETYRICRAITNAGNPYGFNAFNTDAHLIKNSEWGAIAYLTQSQYGRNGTEITINNTNANNTPATVTGITAGGNGINALAINGESAITNNILQSTTGNVYGIYDFSGGAWERVAGYINSAHTNLNLYGSYFIKDIATTSTKYKTLYANNTASDTGPNNYGMNPNPTRKGEAIWETSTSGSETINTSWFGDISYFIYYQYPFCARGGNYLSSEGAGAFTFSYSSGNATVGTSFRVILIAL